MGSSGSSGLPTDAVERATARARLVARGDPARVRGAVAVVCAAFNGEVTARLLEGAIEALDELGVARDDVSVAVVPGAFELPIVAGRLAASGRYRAVVCLGAVIRGETAHFDYVAGQCAAGIQRVAIDTGVPVGFGVLTTDTVEQALARAAPGRGNKGREAVLSALATADVLAVLDEAATADAPTASGGQPRVSSGDGPSGRRRRSPQAASPRRKADA
jgi:6,7-dimethyl-8-ribityllumazine synthase